MMTSWLAYTILASIIGAFGLLAAAELLWPARRGHDGDKWRIAVNFALGIANTALISLVPISGFAVALLADDRQWGLFHAITIPLAMTAITLFILRSLMGYWLHRLLHQWPLLWRVHRLHHSDTAIDLSTGLRSHPLEVLIAALVNAALIIGLGAPPLVVAVIETMMLVAAFWQHANIGITNHAAAVIERLLITPRLHLNHHAAERRLQDSNYGDILSIWDRLFDTYTAPDAGRFALGLEDKSGG